MLLEYDSGRSCVTSQRRNMKTHGSDRCPRIGPFLAKVYRRVSRASTSASVGTVLLLLSLIQGAAGQMQPGLHRSNPAAIGFPRVLELEANRGESTGVPGRDSPGPKVPAAGPVITSPLAVTTTVGQPFTYQFETTGATTLEVTGLPEGLLFGPLLSAIVGTLVTSGTFQVGLIAFGPDGSSTSATGRTGSPFSFQVITSGASAAARLSASGLPADLSVDRRCRVG
jgi:hypothetical protein